MAPATIKVKLNNHSNQTINNEHSSTKKTLLLTKDNCLCDHEMSLLNKIDIAVKHQLKYSHLLTIYNLFMV